MYVEWSAFCKNGFPQMSKTFIYQELHRKKASNCYGHNSWKSFNLTLLTSFTALASGGWLVGSFVGSMGSCLTVFTLRGDIATHASGIALCPATVRFSRTYWRRVVFVCILSSSLFLCWSGSHQLVAASCFFHTWQSAWKNRHAYVVQIHHGMSTVAQM